MTEEITEFLRAEALLGRGLDELDLPTDVVDVLGDLGFETVDDVLDADPVTLPPDVADVLSMAFGAEGVRWGSADGAPTRQSDESDIENAVQSLLEAYRAFHPAESWPDVPWTLFRRRADLELQLPNGEIFRGRLSAPLMLAGTYRAISLGPEVSDEFPRILSFPREPLLEEQIGAELLWAAHAYEEAGEHEEAVFCARRAIRDVRWIRSDEFAETDNGLSLMDVMPTLREDVTRVTDVSRYLGRHDVSYTEAAEAVADCADSPDSLERYETAIALRSLFERAPTDVLVEFCDRYFDSLHRLVTDECEAVCERALHAAHTVGYKLWLGRHYRSAISWLELALDGGVYPGETMRRLAECRLYVDGDIPHGLEERMSLLNKLDESTFRGAWFDDLWREASHVRVAESLARKGDLPAAADAARIALDALPEDGDDRRVLNLRGRALLIVGDVLREEGDRLKARDAWTRAREAFEAASLKAHANEVELRLSSSAR